MEELFPYFRFKQFVAVGISDKLTKFTFAVTKWAYKNVFDPTSDSPYLYGVYINPAAARDRKIYKAILAHELCHVEDVLLNLFPTRKNYKTSADFKESIKDFPEHGPGWQEIANRINGVFGPKLCYYYW